MAAKKLSKKALNKSFWLWFHGHLTKDPLIECTPVVERHGKVDDLSILIIVIKSEVS